LLIETNALPLYAKPPPHTQRDSPGGSAHFGRTIRRIDVFIFDLKHAADGPVNSRLAFGGTVIKTLNFVKFLFTFK